jgi:Amt family ammonium transporter
MIQHNEADQKAINMNSRVIYNVTLLFAASLAFFMQAGFAMVCAGAVRRKNLQNTMLKNLLDACGACLAFYAVGYAFAYGDGSHPNGFIGTTNFFLMDVDDMAMFFFQYAFSAAAATIVAGTLAERCRMSAYFYYSILLSGFVYPVIVHNVWSSHGFLSAGKENPLFGVGVVDIAGSGVVHLTGGITALIATYVLGPRRGRFHDEHTGELLTVPKEIKGHNIGLQVRYGNPLVAAFSENANN